MLAFARFFRYTLSGILWDRRLTSIYTAVFFDLYGTLCDIRTDETRPSLWRAFAAYAALCGADWAPGALRARTLALCEEETHALAAASGLDEEDVEIDLMRVFARLFAEKGAAVSDERLADTALFFRALSYRRPPRLMKGAVETLSALRRSGCGVYLLSNAQRCFTLSELRRLGLDDRFDGIFLSSDYGCKKPSPVFFRAALDRAGRKPEEVLMVGNDMGSDVAGAHALGMPSRYLHSRISPPRRGELPEDCREIRTLTDLCAELL